MKYKRSVVSGFVHRIYRSCSSWYLFHQAIEEAKDILLKNQYPPSFIDDTINNTLTKILSNVDDNSKHVNDSENESVDDSVEDDGQEVSLDSNACIQNFREQDKFKFFMNFRGKPTEKFAMSLKKLNAPCRIIMTLNKTKAALPSLKVKVPKMLQSNVVYKISCSRCDSSYVGQTARHLQQRYREHMGSQGIIRKHYEECGSIPSEDLVNIIGKANGERLLTLEALHISTIKPVLNTKDEFKSRILKLKF